MALPDAYSRYSNNKVQMASKAELTLMLYEGMVKFCNRAIEALDNKDIEKTHNNIIKIENIIDHLRLTLDMKYPVANEFETIYLYLSRRLIEANIKKDREILEEINGHLHMLCDTWKEVMRVNKQKGIKNG